VSNKDLLLAMAFGSDPRERQGKLSVPNAYRLLSQKSIQPVLAMGRGSERLERGSPLEGGPRPESGMLLEGGYFHKGPGERDKGQSSTVSSGLVGRNCIERCTTSRGWWGERKVWTTVGGKGGEDISHRVQSFSFDLGVSQA